MPSRGMQRVRRHLPAGSPEFTAASVARDDLVKERPGQDGSFEQEAGPFQHYRRTLTATVDGAVETIEYRLRIPWFRWLFGPLIRRTLKRRPGPEHVPGTQPWYAPNDRLDDRQVAILGLLAAASMCSAFTNTLFTQTVHKATEDFGIDTTGQGIAGGVVRAGIVFALPFAFGADRLGRRRVIRWLAVVAPLVCALGAVAPTFPVLVATQALGRPLGIALDLLVAVVAAEEMPRSSRAYAISILALASGFGASICVWLIPLTGVARWGWRLPFAFCLVWLAVAVSLRRHLPETVRFQVAHAERPPLKFGRLGTLAAIAFFGNLFVSPASFFQNRYLDEVRGLGDFGVTIFTVLTSAPAALGLLAGGWLADHHGRRRIGATCLVSGTALIAVSFAVGGPVMWGSATVGGIILGTAFPALAVYRTELFPTAQRGRAAGLITTAALGGGIVGLVVTGVATDHGHSYGEVLALLALGQLVVAALVLGRLPESAHRELEELNPEDLATS